MRVDILAARDQVARQRIEQYAAELTEQHGLDPALAERFDVSRIRDKTVAAMFHREATADFLAALADAGNAEDLDSLTVAELKDRAAEAGIEGYGDMRKAELVAALEAAS